VRYPGHFSATPASLNRHPPRLGEHTEELLLAAGYTAEQVSAWREKGVVA